MKRIGLAFIALAVALVVPVSSADAGGNGEWDNLGFYYLTYNSTYGFYDTANVKSTGGSVRIMSNDAYITAELWEYDPGSGNDDYVGEEYLFGWEKKYFNVEKFVDGSNKRAELYVRTYDAPDPGEGTNGIYFWD